MAERVQPIPNAPIQLDGGFNESRDSLLHGPGELSRADDAFYKVNNPAVWSVPGRVAFNSVAEPTAIIGGRYFQFDGATSYIVIHNGTKIREAAVALTGSFVDAVTGLASATTFDSCHYNNNHIAYDGVNRNRVRTTTGWRFHGMLANTTAPTLASTGSGAGFTLSSGAKIIYWVEERVKNADGTIQRRNADTGSTTVTLTGTGALVKPVVTRPAQLNPDATHWALYGTPTNTSYPTAAQIAEVPIATTTIEDTRTGTDPLLPAGEVYQTVAVILYGLAQTFAKNGPPPIATSADVQEDSIVMNDVNDKSRIVFSYPDNLDAFPYSNVIKFETKEADEIQWVRYLGRATVVALRDTLWRIDTLPQPTDSGFSVGRVKAQIEGAHGGVGPQAVTIFSFGQGNLLAYVSRYGILVTDGEVWDIMTGDVDWKGRVDVVSLGRSVLVNNPTEFRLEFTYTPIGGALNSKTLLIHYHPSHAKLSGPDPLHSRARGKVTGPINRGALCKFKANVSGLDEIFAGWSDGVLYREWTGLTNPTESIQFVVRASEKFPGGIGRQSRAARVWIHHQAGQAGQRATARAIMRTEGLDDVQEVRSFPLARKEHTSVYSDLHGESFQFGVEATDPVQQIAIDFIVAEFADTGESTSDGEV